MKEKPVVSYFNLSLCHVFVMGRSMHILDIPLACCLTHPRTPLSINLSHFLSSISPEAESNRAHPTGWSEQNCDWHCPADSLWNSLNVDVSVFSVSTFACVQERVHAPVSKCSHAGVWVCVFDSVYVWPGRFFVTSPLSRASLRWRGGGGGRVGGSSLQHGVQRELRAPQVWVTETFSHVAEFFKYTTHLYKSWNHHVLYRSF